AALLVTATLFWPRGNVAGWRARSRIARQRLGLPAVAMLAVSLAAFAAMGAWNFHNTHWLYRYQTHDQQRRQQAQYEKDYRKYMGMAQPRITDVNVNVAMYPAQRRVDIDGRYVLVNKHDKPIEELLVQLPTLPTRDGKVELDFRPHTVALADPRQGFYLYKLAKPLAPGASMDFGFRMQAAYNGFANEPAGEQVVHNGTFINSFAFPHFCYDENRQLTDNNDRRKHGLGPAQRMPKRDDAAAHADNLISCDADCALPSHAFDQRRPDRAGTRLSAEGVDRERPSLFPLRAGHADPGFLLVPVGTLQGGARQVARREPRGLLRPAASVQHRTDVQGDEVVTGLLHAALRALPIPPVADPGIPGLRRVRAVVREYRAVLGIDRVYRRPAQTFRHRLRHLRDRARDRPPVVGAPGDRRECAGRDDAGRIAGAIFGVDGDEAPVRADPDAQVPQVRAGSLLVRPRRRTRRRGTLGAGREPALHPLPQGFGDFLCAGRLHRRGQGECGAAQVARQGEVPATALHRHPRADRRSARASRAGI